MAFTYGFYNALNNDRTYNAYQFSTLFDGIIVDGVFETIGQHFAVTAGTGMSVNVGTGRAWFNHTWNENDSVMPLNLPASDLNRARYDAIVLEVGDPNTDRTNTIKVVSGTPAVNPVKPTLNRGSTGNSGVDTSDETDPPWQHALAYVLVPAGAESVSASNIEIVVGKDETPFVTGPLETRSIEELFNQWDAQFTTWFNNLKAQLTDNVVTNLQAQIDQRVKYTDKATDAEAAAGIADNKWVTPKQINPLSSLKVGDIICSGRKMEEETNGKWALCDGRVYSGDEYPELLQKVGMRYGAEYQYKKCIPAETSYGSSIEYLGIKDKPEFLCRSDGSGFLYLSYQINSSSRKNYLFYIPANYNIGYLSSVLTYNGSAQDYYAVYMFDDFVYYVNGADKNIKIINSSNNVVTIAPTEISITWYPLCAFKYNNYIYIVVTTTNQSTISSIGIAYYYIRVAPDNSVYTKAMGTLTTEEGVWGHAVFNYTDHLIYLTSPNYAYNIDSEKFFEVTKPQILEDFGKSNLKKLGVYTNNGTVCHTNSGTYNLRSFSKTNANSIVYNRYFSFENNGEYFYGYMADKDRFYQLVPNHGERKLIPFQRITNQLPSNVLTENFNGSLSNIDYVLPNIAAAMDPENIKFMPYCGFGSVWNSSVSKYNMSINIAIYEIQKNRIRLPNYNSYLNYTGSGISIMTEVDNRYIKLL